MQIFLRTNCGEAVGGGVSQGGGYRVRHRFARRAVKGNRYIREAEARRLFFCIRLRALCVIGLDIVYIMQIIVLIDMLCIDISHDVCIAPYT